MLTKKRLLIAASSVTALAGAGAMVAGVTFGLFSSSATQTGTNSFTAGTVAVGTPATTVCTVTNIVPGDSSTGFSPLPIGQTDTPTAACTFAVTNTSTVPTYVGVVLAPTGTLYDTTVKGLQYQISDGTVNYTASGVLNNSGGTAASPLLVSLAPDAASSGKTHTVTVNWALPTASPNSYQNLNSTLTMTIEAVQSGNNGSTTGCTAGSQCAGITAWS